MHTSTTVLACVWVIMARVCRVECRFSVGYPCFPAAWQAAGKPQCRKCMVFGKVPPICVIRVLLYPYMKESFLYSSRVVVTKTYISYTRIISSASQAGEMDVWLAPNHALTLHHPYTHPPHCGTQEADRLTWRRQERGTIRPDVSPGANRDMPHDGANTKNSTADVPRFWGTPQEC